VREARETGLGCERSICSLGRGFTSGGTGKVLSAVVSGGLKAEGGPRRIRRSSKGRSGLRNFIKSENGTDGRVPGRGAFSLYVKGKASGVARIMGDDSKVARKTGRAHFQHTWAPVRWRESCI